MDNCSIDRASLFGYILTRGGGHGAGGAQPPQMILQNKADRAYAREAQRWEGIEAKFEYEQTAAADKLAQDAPHRNKGSVPYNLVSLKPVRCSPVPSFLLLLSLCVHTHTHTHTHL
jgi:hypothetical protein